jgi:hypothetical protein
VSAGFSAQTQRDDGLAGYSERTRFDGVSARHASTIRSRIRLIAQDDDLAGPKPLFDCINNQYQRLHVGHVAGPDLAECVLEVRAVRIRGHALLRSELLVVRERLLRDLITDSLPQFDKSALRAYRRKSTPPASVADGQCELIVSGEQSHTPATVQAQEQPCSQLLITHVVLGVQPVAGFQ